VTSREVQGLKYVQVHSFKVEIKFALLILEVKKWFHRILLCCPRIKSEPTSQSPGKIGVKQDGEMKEGSIWCHP
jgi:hypothetical protein